MPNTYQAKVNIFGLSIGDLVNYDQATGFFVAEKDEKIKFIPMQVENKDYFIVYNADFADKIGKYILYKTSHGSYPARIVSVKSYPDKTVKAKIKIHDGYNFPGEKEELTINIDKTTKYIQNGYFINSVGSVEFILGISDKNIKKIEQLKEYGNLFTLKIIAEEYRNQIKRILGNAL